MAKRRKESWRRWMHFALALACWPCLFSVFCMPWSRPRLPPSAPRNPQNPSHKLAVFLWLASSKCQTAKSGHQASHTGLVGARVLTMVSAQEKTVSEGTSQLRIEGLTSDTLSIQLVCKGSYATCTVYTVPKDCSRSATPYSIQDVLSHCQCPKQIPICIS